MFIVITIIVFFKIPYSTTKNSFYADIQRHSEHTIAHSDVFSEQEIVHLPEPVQNHFRAAGLIGQPKMASVTADVTSAILRESRDGSPMIIEYTLYSFAYEPVRLAYIRTSMFGIPFEGFDSLQDGTGFMRGVIGKVFTLFNQTGIDMDRAQLITYLGECFIIPTSLFGEHITWEAIDANHARAAITYGEITGSGIFVFGDDGIVRSFHSDERARIGNDGSVDFPGWTVLYDDWKRNENGIYMPSSIKTIWHDNDGDFIYFEATEINITILEEQT